LTKGTDITELFETHHLDADRVNKMIRFMEADRQDGEPPLPPRNSPFTFDPDGFYCTLRRRIWEAHGGETRDSGKSNVAALGPSTQSKILADTMVAVSLGLTAAAGASKSWGTAAMIAAATGVVNGMFIGIGHNFMHQADNFRRHYQNISGFNSPQFRMHHALSHHPYTNTVVDAETNTFLSADLSFFPTSLTGDRGETMLQKIRHRLVLSAVCGLAIPLQTVGRFVQLLVGKYPGDNEDKMVTMSVSLAQLTLLTGMLAGKHGDAKRAAGLWMVMLASTSNLFLWLNFLTGPHFNDKCWHQGDTLDSRDWGMLQIQTNTERASMSHDDNLVNNLWQVPTFGLHHLHHLFPTIDASELSKCVPVFEATCEEFGIEFNLMSDRELREGLFKCIDGYESNARTLNGMRAKL
jgi:fatty acid desaturase